MPSNHPERERSKAMRHGRGHPPRSDRPELLQKFGEYIDAHDIPVIAEFAYINHVARQQLYEWPEFASTLQRCVNKKEANLEIRSLYNQINVAQAIFSLKQLGWTDRGEQTLKGQKNVPVTFIVSENVAGDG